MVVIYNDSLEEYEELCYDCYGIGIIDTVFCGKVECVTCKGYGYITWIDKIVNNRKDILISKGSKLYCPSCGKWLATAKVNIAKNYPIITTLLDSVWRPKDGISCPFCRTAVYEYSMTSKNWIKLKGIKYEG